MAIQKGSQAPEFTLVNDQQKEVSLSDYRGKNVVLLFFPLSFTSVCTEELCSVRDSMSDYEQANAEVLGISVDSPFVLAEFKKQQNFNFDLLSDFNAEVSRDYGALYEDFVMGLRNVAKRSAFVIDKDGVIQYAEVLENAGELPDLEQIKQEVAALN